MRTEIFVKYTGVDLTEIHQALELSDDFRLPITFSISDIREPDKRNTAYSKTLVIPGTPNNNKLFSHIFDVGVDNNFNPNKKADVVIITDGLEQFSGVLQLMQINKLRELIEYECVVFGRLDNIFTALGDAKLEELDFSEHDHALTQVNQVASWTAPVGSGYVYPLIDRGWTDLNTIEVRQLSPALYVKEVVDKIFSYAGFSYDSAFFNTDYFKRLIIPYSSGTLKYSESEVGEREFRSELTATQSNAFTGATADYVTEFDDDFTAPNKDPEGQYNPALGFFTAGRAGWYRFDTQMTIKLRHQPTAPVTVSGVFIRVEARIVINGVANPGTLVEYELSGLINPGDLSAEQILYVSPSGSQRLEEFDTAYVQLHVTSISYGGGYPIVAPGNPYNTTGGTLYIEVLSGSTFYNTVDNVGIEEGDAVDMNSALPRGVKMTDFLLSIAKMHNLYIDVDRDVSTKLIVEPRDDFYTSDVVDWTDKLGVDSGIQIKPMSELNAKNYLWTYKQDRDRDNVRYTSQNYNTNHPEIYGEKYIEVDNDFVTETSKTELIFAPTPLTGEGADKVLPSIAFLNDKGEVVKDSACVPRILYWGGTKDCLPWVHRSIDLVTDTTRYYYPYAGHFDDPNLPTLDINFGVTAQVFYTLRQVTDNNLYNRYYSRFINEITSKDSKLLTASFYLTPVDIMNLSFRALYFIDGHYYRLNKVIEHDLLSDDLTRCEFIKISESPAFTPTESENNGGISQGKPKYYDRVPKNDNQINTNLRDNISVIGTGNVVDGTNIQIVGIGNIIGSGATNVIITGNGNTVLPGLENVVIIGSSNVTAEESNTAWINGTPYVPYVPGSAEAGDIILAGYTIQPPMPLADGDTVLSALGKLEGQMLTKEPTITAGTSVQYWAGDKTWQTFDTSVRNAVITGYTSGSNTALSATDTVVQAFGKVQGQINARPTGTGAANQITYWSGTNAVTGNTGFLFDGTNRVAIGTSTYGATDSRITVQGPTANNKSAHLTFLSTTGTRYSGLSMLNQAGVYNFMVGYNLRYNDLGSGVVRYDTGHGAAAVILGPIGADQSFQTRLYTNAGAVFGGVTQTNDTIVWLLNVASSTATFAATPGGFNAGQIMHGTNPAYSIRSVLSGHNQDWYLGLTSTGAIGEYIARTSSPTISDYIRFTFFNSAYTTDVFRTGWGKSVTAPGADYVARNNFYGSDNGSTLMAVSIRGLSNGKGAFFHNDGRLYLTGTSGTYAAPSAGLHANCSVIIDPGGAKVLEISSAGAIGFWGAAVSLKVPSATALAMGALVGPDAVDNANVRQVVLEIKAALTAYGLI